MHCGIKKAFNYHRKSVWEEMLEVAEKRNIPQMPGLVEAQVDIYEAFGFDIPEGCTPGDTQRTAFSSRR
jgi:hypothetical protein